MKLFFRFVGIVFFALAIPIIGSFGYYWLVTLVLTLLTIAAGLAFFTLASLMEKVAFLQQKLNLYESSDEDPPDELPQKVCPDCGNSYDFDYPKCPYCGSADITPA